MKLNINKSEFSKALVRVQSIVEKRNSMPILANALLEASKTPEGGSLRVSATDLEVGLTGLHPAKVATAGSVTVAARKLHEIVRELPEETISLETTSNSYLEIRCGRSRFVLAGAAGEEYPTLPSVDVDGGVSIQAAVLSSMIDRTMYAASADEARYNLNGVFLEVLEKEQKLRMVATDGHRLAYADRCHRRGHRADFQRCDRAAKGHGRAEAPGGRGRRGRGGDRIRREQRRGDHAQRQAGDAPDRRRVPQLPTGSAEGFEARITVASDAFAQVLRRVSLLAAEGGRGVRLQVSPGKLTLSAKNPDLGEAQEEIELDYAGETISIGFNSRYLLDCLGVFKSKEVEVGLIDEMSPVQIRPTDDSDALAVVMPMRL